VIWFAIDYPGFRNLLLGIAWVAGVFIAFACINLVARYRAPVSNCPLMAYALSDG
jgi:hypothetical protein